MHLCLRGLLLLSMFILSAAVLGAQEQVRKATAEKEAMTTKVFKLPYNFIELSQLGVPSAEPTAAADPFAPSPPAHAPPQLPNFKSSRKILEEQLGMAFPPGASAFFDPVTYELTVHHTPAMLELTEGFLETLMYHGPSGTTLAFTLTLVEGPGKLIREANAAASSTADAHPQLETLLATAAKAPGSGVRVVGETFFEARPGMRASVEAVRERRQVTGFKTKADKAAATTPPATGATTPAATNDEAALDGPLIRQDGLHLELESTLGADGKTLETTFALALGPESAVKADGHGTTTRAAPASDLRKAQFLTGISSTSGSTKLIGMTQPMDADAGAGSSKDNDKDNEEDLLWAVFLTGQVRRVTTSPCAINPPGVVQEKLAKGLRAVAFSVPEGLLESLIPVQYYFTPPAQQALRPWLAAQGVSFAKGGSIAHQGGLLHLVSTPEDIEIITALVEHAARKAAHSIAVSVHTFQVPAALLRELRAAPSAKGDDAALLAAVESATARGEATPLSSAFFEGKSGKRSTHDSSRNHSHLAQFGTSGGSSRPRLAFHEETVGTFLEIEPTVDRDSRTVGVSYRHELHPAPPARHRQQLRSATPLKDHNLPGSDFHTLRTSTATVLASGRAKLISLQPPRSQGRRQQAPRCCGPPSCGWMWCRR